MNHVKFDSAFNFKYSPRRGTKAAEYDDRVPEDEKQARLIKVIELQKTHTLERNKSFIGRVESVLVEKESKRSKDQWVGRIDANKWVIFDKGIAQIKDIVSVEIIEAKGVSLHGKLINKAEAA
jgi:tRNA-2-methylthio-N6-dimethylallyladenosine synthase